MSLLYPLAQVEIVCSQAILMIHLALTVATTSMRLMRIECTEDPAQLLVMCLDRRRLRANLYRIRLRANENTLPSAQGFPGIRAQLLSVVQMTPGLLPPYRCSL
jgi:hypothetical protein